MRTLSNALAMGAIVAAALGGVAAWPAFAADAAPKQTPATETPAAAPAPGGSTNDSVAAAPSDTAKPNDTVGQATPAAKAKPMRHAALSRKRVERVQTALAQSGENVPIDGLWGPKTTDALKDFQKSHGLRATGHLNHATEKVLSKSS